MKKRRRIGDWYRQAVARKQYDCTKCDTPIYSHSIYERDVYASPKAIEPERTHINPPCAAAYYCGK